LRKLTDKEIRSKLRRCFRYIAQDQNDLSVMLWHGPLHGRSSIRQWERSVIARTATCTRCVEKWWACYGVLLTGDIPLGLDFAAVESHFAREWARTSQVQVPHHGSGRSWNREITKKVADGCTFVIDVGAKNRRHPHRSVVVDVLRSHHCDFVTEHRCFKRSTRFRP
jgi:hypothetical protein